MVGVEALGVVGEAEQVGEGIEGGLGAVAPAQGVDDAVVGRDVDRRRATRCP